MRENPLFAKETARLLASSPPQDLEHVFQILFRYPNREFCRYPKGLHYESMSYARAKERCLACGEMIKKKLAALPKDSILALDVPSSKEWVFLFWGVLAAGFKLFLVNSRLDKATNEALFLSLGVRYVLGTTSYEGVPSLDPETLLRGVYHENSLANSFGSGVLLCTSGTSDTPRVFSYDAEAIIAALAIPPTFNDVNSHINTFVHHVGRQLVYLPLYHVFGLFAVFFFYLSFGQSFVFLPKKATPSQVLETIKREGVTEFFAVPVFFEGVASSIRQAVKESGAKNQARFEKALAKSLALQNSSYSLGLSFARKAFRQIRSRSFGDSLAFMINGGGALNKDTIAFFTALGYPLHNGYGMTEAGIACVDLSLKAKDVALGSIGRPLGPYEFTLLDINAEGVGELAIKSLALSSYEYIDGIRHKRDKSVFLPTGDLAKKTEKGYFLFGRKDEIVVDASGELLSPEKEESAFVSPFLAGKAFLQIAGKNILFLEWAKGVSEEQIQATFAGFLKKNATLAYLFQIREFHTVSSLPLALGFKVRYNALKEDYLAHPENYPLLQLGESEITDEKAYRSILEKVYEAYSESFHKDRADIHEDSTPVSLGGSSLEYYALLTSLSTRFNDPAFLSENAFYQTPKEFALYFLKKGAL
jgi:long-subunit acyl-CoA synthetase (AMP-forming)